MGILGKPYFRGQSIHRLDTKGRLRIPTKFRDILHNHYTDGLIITMMEECLVAYPPEIWEKIESKVEDFSHIEPHQRAFMRYFISSAEECEFDSKGRILIPPLLRQRAGLDSDLILAGVLTSFEIWDKATWDNHMQHNKEHYHEMMGSVTDKGL